jgi:hypothetical protein
MIARNKAFIVPVCIDVTPESGADVPESFQRVQWTRMPAGASTDAFVEHVRRLIARHRLARPRSAPFCLGS